MKTIVLSRDNILFALILLCVAFLIPQFASAALPSGFEMQTVAEGFNLPTKIAFSADGRIFVAEKNGTVRVIKNGALNTEPVIRLTDVNTYGDRGLIGMALDPNFVSNGYMYLLYTYENTPGSNIAGIKTGRLVRVTVINDTAIESSKVVLLGTVGGTVITPSCDNYPTTSDCIASDSLSHSVGGLRFGPDGKLYVTLGDGASFDYADTRALRAQDLNSLAGKMLRINTDGTAPADNPFYTGSPTANRSKVYAYGLRNAFRFTFRPGNNALVAGDVGWSTWEEIDVIQPGANLGWPCREGGTTTPQGLGCTPNGVATDPVYSYIHDANGAGAVVGGGFSTGSAYPASFANTYFFGDYAQNFIKTMEFNASNQMVSVSNFADGADGTNGPVDIEVGPEGNIYFLAIYTGELKKITHTLGNRKPIATINATPNSGVLPLNVNFSSAGSSDPDGNPISFLWNFDDGATSTVANPSHVYSTAGSYLASLSVLDNQGGIDTKSVSILAGNQAPTVSLLAPFTGDLYVPGETIALNATGTDPETGVLASSALSWRIILHHNTHIHVLQTATGSSASFVAPDHTDPDVYVEIELTGTDPAGLKTKATALMYLNNSTQVTGNLVPNPSFENPETGNPSFPQSWLQGNFGVNNPIFTYPIAGYDGASAVSLNMQSYTSGDAKWYFSPVYVNDDTDYIFSDYYTATVPTSITAQIGNANGTFTYLDLGSVPASAIWTKVVKPFRTPVGARTLTIFHGLDKVGTLSMDAFSLMASTSAVSDTTAPVVTVTVPTALQIVSGTTTLSATASDNVGVAGVTFLIDGLVTGVEKTTDPYSIAVNTLTLTNGNHTVQARARDAVGNSATSSAVTMNVQNALATTTATNLIVNPNVETVSTTTPTKPYAWNSGKWGTNTTVFTYPSAGAAGNGVKVQTTSYTSGDAKWYFSDVQATGGQQYDVSLKYQSNATTSIDIRYRTTAGTYLYPSIAPVLAPSATFKKVTYRITAPANAVSMTVFHLLESVGTLTTDEYSLTVVDAVKPTVALTAPSASQTIANIFNFQATATDANGVANVALFIDGTSRGTVVSAPYTFPIQTATLTNGAHTAFARATDNAGNIATSTTISFTVTNVTDATLPVVTLVSPAVGATVTGTYSLSATATDNVGVVGVQFLIDNIAQGAELTSAPYTISWNTLAVANGAHTVKVIARDAANNIASTSRTVTVGNSTATTSANLLVNPSFETANGANPQGWTLGGWGSNTRVFTYPIVGPDAKKAVRVEVSNYVDGDAKWVHDEVPVTPGTLYRYDTKYRSSTISDLIGQYRFSNGTLGYFGLVKEIQPTTSWTPVTGTFSPPVGVVGVTMFHLISANGYLEQDDAGLFAIGSTTVNTDTEAPIVAFTSPSTGATVSGPVNIVASSSDNVGVTYVIFAVDGIVISPQITVSPYTYVWDSTTFVNGSHVLKATTHDAVGNNSINTITINVNNQTGGGGTTTPPIASSTNLIENPSFETTDGTGNPTQWFKGEWGTNTPVFTYPVAGRTTAKAAQLQINTYTNGDAKWYFAPKTVIPGNQYTFSDYYTSTATSSLTVRYTYAPNVYTYHTDVILAPSANWSQANLTMIPPANATLATVFHMLDSVGQLIVDDYSLSQ